jgi:hypothetical protein
MERFKEKTKIQYLFNALQKCYPISDKLLIRLLERIGIYSN